jgi:hypothetical protein
MEVRSDRTPQANDCDEKNRAVDWQLTFFTKLFLM